MAVVAGIQWEDRFYSGLNPVMPARVASRSHSRTRLRTRARVCVSVCRSLAPPRNGRCRCRCLSLSLFFLPFFSLPFSLSFISYCFFSTFFFPLSILSIFPPLYLRPALSLCLSQDNVWSLWHERGERRKVSKGEKNTRWPDIITRTGS